MASKGGNFYDELFYETEREESRRKSEKKQKLQQALSTQKKSAKENKNKPKNMMDHKFTPEVDSSRPGKRVYDRISGTGRGFVVFLCFLL